jgi:4-alpha-glucanotransferase
MGPTARASGILLHPTSLPGRHGIGDLGAGARAFVDFLQRSGATFWQILPLVPPGPGGSPYSSRSSLAMNTYLIDLDALVRAGLLTQDDVAAPDVSADTLTPEVVRAVKDPALFKASRRLAADPSHPLHAERERFVSDNPWVADYALYEALRRKNGELAFWDWPAGERDRDEATLGAAREELSELVYDLITQQALVEMQWRELRALCAQAGVRVIGDVPLYVDADSADVWSNREVFQLDEAGRPTALSGAPPDPFSEVGQLWGNPLYDWEQQRRTGHGFCVSRLRRALTLADVVRIDHFRGLSRYWDVPVGAEDARAGQWRDGPGRALFDDLERALGALPIIAEDLGLLDDDVHALRRDVGLPGMKVLQFAFGEDADNPYLPHHHSEDSVVYTGTHDNDTTLGWWLASGERTRDHVRRYFAIDGNDVVWDMIRAAYASVARWCVVPMQDVLALDGGARMNKPGLAEGNWGWRVRVDAFNDGLASRLRSLATLYGRLPGATG